MSFAILSYPLGVMWRLSTQYSAISFSVTDEESPSLFVLFMMTRSFRQSPKRVSEVGTDRQTEGLSLRMRAEGQDLAQLMRKNKPGVSVWG